VRKTDSEPVRFACKNQKQMSGLGKRRARRGGQKKKESTRKQRPEGKCVKVFSVNAFPFRKGNQAALEENTLATLHCETFNGRVMSLLAVSLLRSCYMTAFKLCRRLCWSSLNGVCVCVCVFLCAYIFDATAAASWSSKATRLLLTEYFAL